MSAPENVRDRRARRRNVRSKRPFLERMVAKAGRSVRKGWESKRWLVLGRDRPPQVDIVLVGTKPRQRERESLSLGKCLLVSPPFLPLFWRKSYIYAEISKRPSSSLGDNRMTGYREFQGSRSMALFFCLPENVFANIETGRALYRQKRS